MFMVKILGVVLIVMSGTFTGFWKSKSFIDRARKITLLLEGTNMLLNYVEQEYDLEFAIKSSFKKCSFLKKINDKLFCCDSDLKNDNALINEFFSCLGNSIKKIERDRINCFLISLKARLKEAENDAAQKGKIYQMLGICAGLTLGILLV